jgi:putative glycosyltransferase (TIGR04372 family)
MLSRQVRRQLFQVKNGGIPAVVKKVSKLRAFLTWVDSALFGRARLQKKICKVAPALKAIVDNQVGATSAEIIADQEAAVIALQARVLRDSMKMTEAVKLIADTEKKYPKSVELLKTKAQIHFRMGDWIKFVETSLRASAVCDQIAAHRQLKNINVRFLGSDWTGPMGHVRQLEAVIKLEKLSLLSEESRILLYDPRFVANLPLLTLLGKDLTLVKASRTEIDKFASEFEAIVDDVMMFRMKSGVIDQWSATDVANFEWKQSGNTTLLKLDDETEVKGYKVLKRWGLTDKDWFVAIHVREGSHRDQARLPNADIMSYLPMINEIVNRGGHVIRMGSPLMTPLPKMKNVIDYAHVVERVDWMDVFLWAKAKFFVGTQSGGSEAAMCFDTPTIRSNFSSYGHCFWSDKSFMLPKQYRISNHALPLNLRDALRSPIPHCESTVHEDFEFEVIDNSETDLINAANEMFARLESQNWTLTERQVTAQAIRVSEGAVGRLPISDSFLSSHRSFIES